MIEPVRDFVKEFLVDKRFKKVLEVGSRDVNGSIKDQFKDYCDEYIGLDIIEGHGVDVVDDALNIPKLWRKGTFDCVVCVETLEHVKDPVRIVNNMRNVLKRGGWLVICTPGTHHPEHGWPSDYYRYIGNTYRDIFFEGFNHVVYEEKSWENNIIYPDAQFGYGQKP